METVGQVLVRLPQPLYQRLLERTESERREPAEAIVEAVEHWLHEEKQPVEDDRFRRALERTGLLVPPEEKRYATGRSVDRRVLKRKLARLRLDPLLSEDIITDRR